MPCAFCNDRGEVSFDGGQSFEPCDCPAGDAFRDVPFDDAMNAEATDLRLVTDDRPDYSAHNDEIASDRLWGIS